MPDERRKALFRSSREPESPLLAHRTLENQGTRSFINQFSTLDSLQAFPGAPVAGEKLEGGMVFAGRPAVVALPLE